MRFRSLAIVLALAAIVGIAAGMGCGSSGNNSNPYAPNPNPVAESFNSGNLVLGTPFNHTFASAGSYGYRCIYHASSGMTGTVTVDASSSVMLDSVLVGQGGLLSFTPANITVKPGGTVKWKLVSGTHTVTRP